MLRIHLKKHDPSKRYKVTLNHGSLFQTIVIPENVGGYQGEDDAQRFQFSRLDNSIGPIEGHCKGSVDDGIIEKSFEFEGAEGLDNEDLLIVSGK